jgi:hypothetical protein
MERKYTEKGSGFPGWGMVFMRGCLILYSAYISLHITKTVPNPKQHVMKRYGVSKDKTPCIINLGTRRTCDSSVCIALGYGLDNWGSMVRFPERAGYFFLHCVQNGSGAHPASYSMDANQRLFPWG